MSEYTTIDEYLIRFEGKERQVMEELRAVIRKAAPDAIEKISWNMPTFWQRRNLIHFAAAKHHLGIYPGAEPIVHFADRLSEYKTSKGAIQLPWDKPMPYDLIVDIVTFNLAQVS